MTLLNYFTIFLLCWLFWLDWINPDELPQEEQEDTKDPPKEVDVWDNSIMKASGLKKPRFKNMNLDKDIEVIDLTDQLNEAATRTWEVSVTKRLGEIEVLTIEK